MYSVFHLFLQLYFQSVIDRVLVYDIKDLFLKCFVYRKNITDTLDKVIVAPAVTSVNIQPVYAEHQSGWSIRQSQVCDFGSQPYILLAFWESTGFLLQTFYLLNGDNITINLPGPFGNLNVLIGIKCLRYLLAQTKKLSACFYMLAKFISTKLQNSQIQLNRTPFIVAHLDLS